MVVLPYSCFIVSTERRVSLQEVLHDVHGGTSIASWRWKWHECETCILSSRLVSLSCMSRIREVLVGLSWLYVVFPRLYSGMVEYCFGRGWCSFSGFTVYSMLSGLWNSFCVVKDIRIIHIRSFWDLSIRWESAGSLTLPMPPLPPKEKAFQEEVKRKSGF
jgi:hypothetical protein